MKKSWRCAFVRVLMCVLMRGLADGALLCAFVRVPMRVLMRVLMHGLASLSSSNTCESRSPAYLAVGTGGSETWHRRNRGKSKGIGGTGEVTVA